MARPQPRAMSTIYIAQEHSSVPRNNNGTFAKAESPKGYRMKYSDGMLKLAHRVRAEKALGHALPDGAQVHHVDGTKNETSQLVICPNASYHRMLHARTRIIKAGGNPNTDRICRCCKQLKPLSVFIESIASSGKWQCRRCPVKRARQLAAGWGPEKAARQRLQRHALKAKRMEGLSQDFLRS